MNVDVSSLNIEQEEPDATLESEERVFLDIKTYEVI